MSIKPLSTGQRDIIRKMAAILVCAEIEARAIAPQFEKSTGKKYDAKSAQSYLNTFLNNNPEYKRVWTLLLKDKNRHERDFLERLRRENGK
ncbi:hypothetical protein GBC03_22170 [Citrobacter telavivensis]|uniref:Uncharacterized protein n=1 Tax=Citrobacter telavivensis TaxID=2653932 RepID=A0A6L5E2P9_9ENTR|nr:MULTISPECIES: hypothetical protein [Citrobacter]UVY64969.1 MAG: hypothetical protein [Bacteriophage sp.]HED3669568.1 hypothetical protein [Citrobacter amalonaticus]AUZ65891.1 hypothetical protein C2U53_19810 [Citrobacter sp. CFNIH10]MPQ49616.1 hypothetical protein [Citrobacter telavivensis]QFS72715.1 hypothetical protein GBC03_22170 [Citrobacter telavivensis]